MYLFFIFMFCFIIFVYIVKVMVVGLVFCLCFMCIVFGDFLVLFLDWSCFSFLEILLSVFLIKVICFCMEISEINRIMM